jgi:hypothetical protein
MNVNTQFEEELLQVNLAMVLLRAKVPHKGEEIMKYYIVKWKDKEVLFTNSREAIICAEHVAEEYGCNSYVFTEKDGVREEEPFFCCELEY